MNVVTIAREYGAGGYETAHHLAQALGWELLDRELLHQAAALEHLSDAELERLDEKAVSLVDRLRLLPPHAKYIRGLREAANQTVARGNVILVGRGVDQLIPDTANVFPLRLVAPREWRARRMAQREGWTYEQALARCTEEDQVRERFLRYFFGQAPFQLERCALTVNTGRVPIDDVVAAVVAQLRDSATAPTEDISGQQRVLTLARELGAGETGFAAALAKRLGMQVFDRELLEQQASRLGVSESELAAVDEQGTTLFQRYLPGSLPRRSFEALGRLMNELAQRGNVILVGRGGSRLLRDHPHAFHIRLVAPLDVRLRRVMEHRWLREEAARQLIADSDAQRRRFSEESFGADWSNPLEYHATITTGRLGPAALDLAALLAQSHWRRTSTNPNPPGQSP